jgi:hypothetical protein
MIRFGNTTGPSEIGENNAEQCAILFSYDDDRAEAGNRTRQVPVADRNLCTT